MYESNESGRPEIYIQAFPESGEKLRISLEGGGDPRWSANGKEIFYIAPDGTLMVVAVSIISGEKRIQYEKPAALFRTRLSIGGGRPHSYAVARNGQRFLLPIPVQKSLPPVTILLNWADQGK